MKTFKNLPNKSPEVRKNQENHILTSHVTGSPDSNGKTSAKHKRRGNRLGKQKPGGCNGAKRVFFVFVQQFHNLF